MFSGGLGTSGTHEKKRERTETWEDNWTKEQKAVSKKLGDYLGGQVGGGSPSYNEPRVAGMTDQEQAAQGWLTNYMNQDTPQQYGWANQATQRAVNSDYGAIVDPTKTRDLYGWSTGEAATTLEGAQSKNIIDDAATDALFQRIKDQQINRVLPELQNTLANNANLSGMYFSGGHEKLQGDLLQETSASLLDTLAQMKYGDEQARRDLEAQREERRYGTLSDILKTSGTQQYQDIATEQDIAREREGRQLTAAELAAQLGGIQEGEALRKAEAGYTYGQLPRTLEQQGLDAQYEEFLRTLPENNPALAQALEYLALRGQSYQKEKGTSFGSTAGLTTNFSMGGMGGGGG